MSGSLLTFRKNIRPHPKCFLLPVSSLLSGLLQHEHPVFQTPPNSLWYSLISLSETCH
ncbi:hypothetical protein Ciccas_009326, partial [Cichlidogyrus casuarinus]